MGDIRRCTGMILIGSDGRNSGKTELACAIIRKFTPNHAITAVKITTIHTRSKCPKGEQGCGVCGEVGDSFRILKEPAGGSHTDTSRLRDSGAKPVLWLQSRYSALPEALESLVAHLTPDGLWLCESNSIRRFAIPDIFLLVRRDGRTSTKPSAKAVMGYADRVVRSNGQFFDFSPDMLAIKNGMWVFHNS